MSRTSFMLIAGEPSGDLLGAELVASLRAEILDRDLKSPAHPRARVDRFAPEFFGAGGPHMAAAGVKLQVDLTEHAVVGLWEVLKKYRQFRSLFHQLVQIAAQRQPDAIICIDFSGFNLRFAEAVRQQLHAAEGAFGNWRPRLIQYVSPQVWGSRPARAARLRRSVDLLLSILPFEQGWYAEREPSLPVTFVGHPLIDRHARLHEPPASALAPEGSTRPAGASTVLLLPGSRAGELRNHLALLLETWRKLRTAHPALRARMVLPTAALADQARLHGLPPDLQVQVGNLSEALSAADVAIASTGTVTLECAYFGVPTIALYKTSWATYQIAKRLIQVKFLAMPNLLAGEEIYPEFIQDAATPENLAQATSALLADGKRRGRVKGHLKEVVASLGPPGASRRAARAILAAMAM